MNEALVKKLLNAAVQHSSEEFSGSLADAINELMAVSANGGVDVIELVCGVLPKVSSPFGTAMLAVWLGAMVEEGHDAALSFKPVRDAFLRWSVAIQTKADDEVAEGPNGVFFALESCGRSLVSHCSRHEPSLESLRSDSVLVQELKRLEGDSIGAMWLSQLVNQMSADLVVLNVEKQAGALVRYENLSSCFHLFSLLQGALEDWLPLVKRPTKSLLNCARGITSQDEHDQAQWHFAQPGGVASETSSWVWGEAHPATIQTIGGQQVIVLWPMMMAGRGWDSGFFSPQLQSRPPDVKLLRWLSAEEFLKWKVELQLPDIAPVKGSIVANKPWWKRW